jgi:hypothetical protein
VIQASLGGRSHLSAVSCHEASRGHSKPKSCDMFKPLTTPVGEGVAFIGEVLTERERERERERK